MFRKLKEIRGHAGAIYAAEFHQGLLYSGSADKFLTRWQIELAIQDKFAIKFDHAVYRFTFVEENYLVVGLASGDIHVFDLEQNCEIKFFTQHIKAIFSIHYNSVKQHLYVTDADGNISIWEIQAWKLILYLPLDCGKIRRIAIQENGSKIALACQDETIRIFETQGYNELITLQNSHRDGVTAVCFDKTGDYLYSGGKDAYLKLWNLSTLELIKSIPAHNFVIYDLKLMNESILVSTSRDKTIKIWQASNIELIERLDFKAGGHRHSVNGVTMMNEYQFATYSDDKKIIVWEMEIT